MDCPRRYRGRPSYVQQLGLRANERASKVGLEVNASERRQIERAATNFYTGKTSMSPSGVNCAGGYYCDVAHFFVSTTAAAA